MRDTKTWFALGATSERLWQALTRRDKKRSRKKSTTPATTRKPAPPSETAGGPPVRIGQLSEEVVGILETLPEDQRTVVYGALSFSGPIPPPAMYSAYEDVLPGSADRIMTMAEKEQDHRIVMDPKYAEIHAANTKRSQRLAALVMVVGLTAAAILGIYGDIRISGGVLALLGALQVIHRIWQRASQP